MGSKKWSDNNKLLKILPLGLLAIVIGIILFGVIISNEPTSPISPLAIEKQAIEETFDNLDGEGEIKWYDDFFTWNPRAQATSYPFITGTVSIYWDDADTGTMPLAIPYTTTNLIIELELRGTETYTQKLDTGISGASEPGTGVFDNLIWIWIDVAPGEYDEYIKGYWQVGNEIISLSLVRDGQIVQPVTGFVLYRAGLTIPHLVYLPIVMK